MITESLFLANTAQSAPQSSPWSFPIMMILLFGIMYVMMIRPQKRREKERKEMIASVKSGTRVLLTSGIIGHVTNVKENTIVIKISENTKIEAIRSAVSQILDEKDLPSDIDGIR